MLVLGDKIKFYYFFFMEDWNFCQIVQWYYDYNNFYIVQDVKKDWNLIMLGIVVFFGCIEEKYSNIIIDLLINFGKFVYDGINGKIMYIVIVIKVEKDDVGNVIKYDMMYGWNFCNFVFWIMVNYDGLGSYVKKYVKFLFGNWNQ